MKVISVVIMTLFLFFPTKHTNAQQLTKESIETVLLDYLEGTNEQDINRLNRAFTKNSVIFVTRAGEEALTFPASFFLERVKNGQSGGDEERTISIKKISLMDTLAAEARVEAHSKKSGTHYDHIISLVNDNGKWVIASVIIRILKIN